MCIESSLVQGVTPLLYSQVGVIRVSMEGSQGLESAGNEKGLRVARLGIRCDPYLGKHVVGSCFVQCTAKN